MIKLGRCLLVILMASRIGTAAAPTSDDIERARQLQDDGWNDRAEAILRPIVAANPDHAEANYLMAWARFHDGDFESAENHARHAHELAPENPDYLVLLGHSLGRRAQTGSRLKKFGRARGCRECYEKAVAADPEHPSGHIALVRFHLEAPGIVGGKTEKARKHAARVAAIDSLEGYMTWALVHEQLNEDSAATEVDLRAAMRLAPSAEEPLAAFLQFCRRHEMQQTARERLDEMLDDPSATALAHKYLARHHQYHDRWDDAAAEWRALIAIDSTRTEGRMGLGMQHFGREEWAEAIHEFEAVRAEDPSRSDALYGLGRAYLLGGLDPARAADSFRSYLESERKVSWPSRGWAHYGLARAFVKQEDYARARDELERAEAETRHDRRLRQDIKELGREIKGLIYESD